MNRWQTKTWAWSVVWGILVYVAIDVILTLLRPDYNWLHNAESDYGRGPYSWLMDINFILRCLLSLGVVKVLWSQFPGNKGIKRATYWIVIWAVASGLLAFFADNPYGYSRLPSGSVHQLLAVIDFLSVIVAMVIIIRPLIKVGFSRLTMGILIGLTVLSCLFLILTHHSAFRPHAFGGLYERIFLASVLTWEAVLTVASVRPRHVSAHPHSLSGKN